MHKSPRDNAREESSLDWQPIPSNLDAGQECMLSYHRMRSWSLVLEARQIPYRALRHGFGWKLVVPSALIETSARELKQYENENRDWPPPSPQGTPLVDNRTTTVWILVAVGIFYNVSLHPVSLAGHYPVDWKALGNAHAGKIMDGQWWRLVTSLTLHADWQHLLSNLVIGGFFISRLCRDILSGPAWVLIITSGVLGNLLNAWLQTPDHRAVGASTAIFGVVGILAAISMVRYRRQLRPKRRWGLPVAAALGLLAMLGAGGDNTDLGAHLFGFLSGLPLGIVAELLIEKHGRPKHLLNTFLAMSSIAIVALAWLAALLWGS